MRSDAYFWNMNTYKILVIACIIVALIIVIILTRPYWMRLFSPKLSCSANILYAGDSLTVSSSSYADHVATHCKSVTLPQKLAKTGERTSWLVENLPSRLSPSINAVSVWMGLNDIYAHRNIESTKLNLQKIYDMIHKNGSKVIALTIPRTLGYPLSDSDTRRLTEELNHWIRNNSSVDILVDAEKILSRGTSTTLSEFLNIDKLHVNSTGNWYIFEEFIKNFK